MPRAFLAAAVTRLAQELEQLAKGAATPDNIDRVQTTVSWAQALQNAIRTQTHSGQKAHTWLTATEAQQLLDACKRKTRVATVFLNKASCLRFNPTFLMEKSDDWQLRIKYVFLKVEIKLLPGCVR